MINLEFTPVFIIGAPRSGTNALRDALCSLPEFATWDCDEINPIWRHGNIAHPHDQFDADMASQGIITFIRKAFVKSWSRFGKPEYLVEKTCANSLRVPFMVRVFPEARFIFLTRDGPDVVASAQKRWQGKMELPTLPYYWSKVRNTPIWDIPIYSFRFALARFRMLLGTTDRLSFWGPQYRGIRDDLKELPLDEICAKQWVTCVEKAETALNDLPANRVCRVSYEQLVTSAEVQLERIANFLDVEPDHAALTAACTNLSATSIGQGRRTLIKQGNNARLTEIMRQTLSKLGYETELG